MKYTLIAHTCYGTSTYTYVHATEPAKALERAVEELDRFRARLTFLVGTITDENGKILFLYHSTNFVRHCENMKELMP